MVRLSASVALLLATSATTRAHTVHHRALQTLQADDPCESNFGELVSVQPFYKGALGQCVCSFTDGLSGLDALDQDALGTPDTNDNYFTDIIGAINSLLQSLSYDYSNECSQNDVCESCIGTVCGAISATEMIEIEGNDGT